MPPPSRPYIIGTNLLTRFHEDSTINVAPSVKKKVQTKLPENQETRKKDPQLIQTIFELNCQKTAPPPGGHVFSPIMTIFELVRDINKTNVLTKNTAPLPGGHLHEDWASDVTSTVFTSFKLSRGINGTNVLTNFHEDRK
ncbi:hypothetical protein DPMN_161686 [Dreissena polymorpha]|uniref:Uncharacterized protein n=1 Tax=Dreissena polymorpha TaxID=45954 RepID=A0A9D4ISX7_DREPO|nr:hypothetical protein DPMN_161686 [Dreissena polymorpha]